LKLHLKKKESSLPLIEQNPFLIEVKNQGTIPPEIKGRFLERYATAGKKRGTGLGGFSARLMARTLGGDIGFVSTEEAGTVVTVSIPYRGKSSRSKLTVRRCDESSDC